MVRSRLSRAKAKPYVWAKAETPHSRLPGDGRHGYGLAAACFAHTVLTTPICCEGPTSDF